MLIVNKIFTANKIAGIENGNKLIRKCEKLSKIRKLLKNLKLFKSKNLKAKKLLKSQKLAKSERKLLKSENLFYFNIKKNRLSFLNSNAKITFNCL